MAKQSVYTVFNNVVTDMLTDMSERFPQSRELSACATFHGMASKANVKLPYDKFVEYAILPYGDRLVAHDDAFFMDQGYEDVAGSEGSGFVSALKGLWKHMSPDDKKCVHDYLDLMLSVHDNISRGRADAVAAAR